MIGNIVEWFDFAIYGLLATYIAEKFFLHYLDRYPGAYEASNNLACCQRDTRIHTIHSHCSDEGLPQDVLQTHVMSISSN